MDFFAQQDIARRKSVFLVFLFVFSIIFLVAISNIAVFCFYAYFNSDSVLNFYNYWHLKTFLWITIPLSFTLFTLTYLKLKEFRDTTNILNNYFNAVLINNNKANTQERVLLNIVCEMSIASGIPPVNVYVMNDFGINSFAIGNNYDDASIVVTSTALEKLSRDELQAMVAHEFAKIFTDDMTLNVKLIAITYSLLSISLIGKWIYYGISYSSKESKRNDEFSLIHLVFWFLAAIIGTFLFIFGSVGYILANIIKFLIVRQRMYLNDSIAIEYIRNPIAFINLLKISSIHQSYTKYHDLFEHAYFIQNNDSFFNRIFDIYPDVRERIDRLNQNKIYDLPIKKEQEEKAKVKKNKKEEFKEKLFSKDNIVQTVTGIVLFDNFEKVQSYGKSISQKKDVLPTLIINMLENIETTKALIISLLLNGDNSQKEKQLELIKDVNLNSLVLTNYQEIKEFEGKYNLLIYYYSLSILKELNIDEYRVFRNLLNKIIYLDSVVDIFEWNIENILVRQLDVHFLLREEKEEKYFSYENLQYSLEIFLSVISYSQETTEFKSYACFEEAVKSQGMSSLNFIEKKDVSNKMLKHALIELEYCSLELRKKILDACIICICADNIVENWEIELLYSISILLKIPLPLFEINKTF